VGVRDIGTDERYVRGKHFEICACLHHCVGGIEKEMEANARRIARLPELEEAYLAQAAEIQALKAERVKDHENINLKADFIEKTLNDCAAQAAEIEAFKAAQSYTYIGKDGKPRLARDMEDEIDRLREALMPFSIMAGLMFARNWNDDSAAISFVTPDGPIRLTFKEFREARAALKSEGE
jgi:hypothetical protein